MKNFVKPDSLTSFNGSGLTGSFKEINPLGFDGPAVLVRLINASNQDVAVSFDGVHAHDYCVKNSVLELSLQTNAMPNNYRAVLKKGTVVSVSGASATGYLYLAAYCLES